MLTCSKCNAQAPDHLTHCSNCGANFKEFSSTSTALKRFQANPRVKFIRLVVMENACPACQSMAGTFQKDNVPALPREGCSHHLGCRCFYQPFLDEIYP